jgi:alpha-mannosidase
LTEAWKAVLVNQFHDILPGSHTAPVAQEAEESYRQALGAFESIRAAAQDAIARSAVTDSQPGAPYVVFNSLNWRRTGLVRTQLDRPGALSIIDGDGQPVPSQIVEERDGRRFLLFTARDVPSVGCRTYYVSRAGRSPVSPACPPKASAQSLENRFFRIELNRRGEISRLFDKRSRREVIADGQTANVFQLFEDKPGVYDAWDIVINYKDKSWDISGVRRITAVEEGPVRAGIRIEKEFFNSRLVQTIRAYADIPRIDFETWIDWHEHNKLLKVSFPVAVLSRRATYDLSYGSIQRPTHGNTSWDRAKFEVCGHQWADLSETDYGVSLLNDSRYGWDIEGSRMRLSLLRGPVRPDPDSDQGEHELTYSLFPHAGGWQEAGTVQEAYSLNSPLSAVRAKRHGGSLSDRHSFLQVEPADVLVGALKPAEEGSGYILRLVEVLGGRKQVAVRLDRGMSQVQECDLLERAERNVPTNAKEFRTWIRPFELKTFRVRVQPTHA